mgnify:CR=1 FL=1
MIKHNIFKFGEKSILLIMGLLTFAIGVIAREKRWGDEWKMELFSNEQIVIMGHYQGAYRIYCSMCERSTNKPIIKRFQWYGNIGDEDSLIVYCDEYDKRGFVNVKTGKIAIPPQYAHAWNFSEGVGAISRDNKIGFVNAQGEEVIPCQYTAGEHSVKRLGFAFHGGLCVMTNERNQCGIINRHGEWILAPQYDCIWNANSAGLRIFQNNGLYGVMDKVGNIIHPVQYEYMRDEDGHFIVENKGIRSSIGYDFHVIDSFLCDYFEKLTYMDENENIHATPYIKYHLGQNEGIIDEDGHIIIPAIYYCVKIVNSNLFKAKSKDSYYWILLDAQGKVLPIVSFR